MTVETAKLEAQRIVGGVGTGKTEHLMEHITQLVSQGIEPARIVAFCATPQACHAFTGRLHKRVGNDAAAIRITTPRAFALEILASNNAVAFTGREPHLLAPFEEAFLFEDMKVSGLKPRRLKEMIKFFYRSWTELADSNPDWLLPGEEESTHSLLKANLSFMRAVVEPEVANLAVRFVQANDEARASYAYEHVLADDYQLLSRASQTLTNLTALRSITIAGDPNACVDAYDSYPYAKGLDEFLDTYPQAVEENLVICQRSQTTTHAAKNLLSDTSMTPLAFEENPTVTASPLSIPCNTSSVNGVSSLETIQAEDPADEFSRIASLIEQALEQGSRVSSIAVAVPNAVWGRNVVASLNTKGVTAEALPSVCPIRGDVRNNDTCVEARIATALDLVANPHDAAAWRCWCGYGDYLVNSASFTHVRTHAQEEGIGLVEALAVLAATSNANDSGVNIVGSQRVLAAYRAGCALIERAHNLEGMQLLSELTHAVTDGATSTVPATIANLCLTDDSTTGNNTPEQDVRQDQRKTASVLAQRLRQHILAPTLHNANAVAVIPYDALAGLSPDILVVAGFVNGFIPCRDYFDITTTPLDKQEKMHASDTRRVYTLAGKANQRLVLSYFTSVDLESAGKLKLRINRIRLRNGIRTCTIEPSMFLPLMAENS